MAIIPAIKTYKIKPILRLVNETSIPVPDDTGLNTVIATTTKIPVIAQTIFKYLPLIVSFSALIINGIEKTINPIKTELIL